MNDAQRDSRPATARARLTDYCLIAALLAVLVISWRNPTTGDPDLHQAARQAMAQHVGQTFIQEPRSEPPFIEPGAVHARTSN